MRFVRTMILRIMSVAILAQFAGTVIYGQINDARVNRAFENRYFITRVAGDNAPKSQVWSDGSWFKIADGEIQVGGRGTNGHKWSTSSYCVPIVGCELYAGDLVRNGRRSFIILSYGTGADNSYDTRLTLLLMGANGMPVPWAVTGAFHADDNGIAELVQDTNGNAYIIHPLRIGFSAAGGYSVGYSLYRIEDDKIGIVEGQFQGVRWPYMPTTNADNATLKQVLSQTNISVDEKRMAAERSSALEQKRVLGYKAEADASLETQQKAVSAPAEGQYPMISDIAVTAVTDKLFLSDGTRMDLPAILVLDRRDNSRQIVINPDAEQVEQLWKQPYTVHSTGTECTDVDNCRPFLLWASDGEDGRSAH